MGGDPDLITEEMRPVNAQSFGLIYTSPLMLLTHRLTTEEFYKSKCSPSSLESLLLSVQLYSKLLHKSAIMILDCPWSRDRKTLEFKTRILGDIYRVCDSAARSKMI